MKHRFYVLAGIMAFDFIACDPPTERARLDFERMRRQQRAASYESSTVFANGMVMQAPPEGTMSREAFDAGEAVMTGRRNGKYVTEIPLSLTSEEHRRGEDDFRVYCAVCHGRDGTGGTVVASNMRPPPPSLVTDSARKIAEGQLFDFIANGRGRMPPYNWALSPRERWAVIAALRSLQRAR